MSVLLQNVEKPVRQNIDGGIGVSRDVGKLDLCSGGFTYLNPSDGIASREHMLKAKRRVQTRRESLERAASIEAAHVSEVQEWSDESGTVWQYVVLDEKEIRIERCNAYGAKLAIPTDIEGKPVVALADDACAYLPAVEEILCPDSIFSIGCCAFRENGKLSKVVLPMYLARFDSAWFRNCPRIDHLALPGHVAQLDSSIFDIPGLRTLIVGAGTREVEPGTFAKSALEVIEIDGNNPFLMTDGRAVYSHGGSVLVALAVPGTEYGILDGCKAVAQKGLSNFECVKRIKVSENLEVLGEFAFSRTGITAFVSPPSLKHIGEKAFFNCAELEEVRLNEGLVSVSDNAFTGTDIHELRLPSSVGELGNPLAARTALTYSGADATFSLAKGSAHLKLDEAGGLYREGDSGKHLVRMMDPNARFYAVQSGTVGIGEGAFANHACIAEVVLPEGLMDIGRAAFKACRTLVQVSIPNSVRRVEEEAFLDTNIASIRLPADLEHVGVNALVTYGAHRGTVEPSLHEVLVSEGNERFYTASGLLLERKDEGRSRVVLCTGAVEAIRVPEEVDEIAPYAFNGVLCIRALHLSDRIARVGTRGLAVDCLIERIHIDLIEPISGHESFDLRFPDTDRGTQQMMLALGIPDHVDAAALFEHYDNAVINRSGFDAKNDGGLGLYDQVTRIVERLLDPVLLTPVNRSMYDRILKNNIEKMCVDAAKHDDRKVIEKLLDLGYLNAGNLYPVIDRIAALQDAAMMGYLLEATRLRFGQDAMDFDL